jgi:dipeptidyl aminopeptidase/acylaminoacyl peptidase
MRTSAWNGVLAAAILAIGCGGGGKKTTTVTEPEPGGGGVPGGVEGGVEGGVPGGVAEEPAVAQGNPKDDLIPRSVLFGNPERASVQISKDGKWVSWLAPSDGVLNVWVAPADDLTKAKPVTADKTRPVFRYFWAYDSKHLLYLQDKAGDENFHLHRVVAETGEVKDLTPIDGARVEVQALSEKKPSTVVVGINDRDPSIFDAYAIDLGTGEKKLLAQNDQQFVGWIFDNDLNLRFAQKMDETGAMLTMVKDKKGWKEFDKVGSEDMLTTSILGFDKKGTSYYAFDSRGRDTAALYKVDAKSKKKKVLYEDKKVDIGGLIVHPTEHTVQAVNINYDKPRWVVLDKKIKKDLDALTKIGGSAPGITSRTLDDKVWIVAFDTDAGSPKYYRWDRAKQKETFLFSVQPALDEQPLVPMHPVVIKTRDDLDMVSYLTLPKDADANADGKADAPVPMVLLVHGGPWGRDQWGFDPLHQLLANRGYAVLSPNFRGSTGFGKGFTNAGDKQWGKKMHDDLLDSVAWAVSNGVTSKEKVCIMGGSYGGYATLAGLTLTPDEFACGVDIVGPSSIVTLLETIPPYWQPMIKLFHNRVGDPTTPEGKAALLEVSPLTHAAKITRPLLIGQGANDPRVKKSESDQIVAAMKAKNIPVSYVVFPDEGHGFARPENNLAFFAVTEAFLSVHLGGYYQPIKDAELSASSMVVEAGKQWLPGLPRGGGGNSVSAR